MNNEAPFLGHIYVSQRAVANIAFHAAMQSYGVVGLTSKNLVDGLANRIVKDPTQGVDVHYDGENISIDLYVILEYGTRITSVADSVSHTIRYQVEKALGLPVFSVNVHVQGLRISDSD
jgi:uncharacterized alkaline shock family protein YloU